MKILNFIHGKAMYMSGFFIIFLLLFSNSEIIAQSYVSTDEAKGIIKKELQGISGNYTFVDSEASSATYSILSQNEVSYIFGESIATEISKGTSVKDSLLKVYNKLKAKGLAVEKLNISRSKFNQILQN